MKSVLAFILFAAMMCWFMFSPIYKHIIIVRQAVLQQEVDYLLEVGANGDHGYINSSMMTASRERLAGHGLKPGLLRYEVKAADGSDATDASAPLPRGVGLELIIRYPIEGLFEIDRLIGIAPPDEDTLMSASGIKMSEYVP